MAFLRFRFSAAHVAALLLALAACGTTASDDSADSGRVEAGTDAGGDGPGLAEVGEDAGVDSTVLDRGASDADAELDLAPPPCTGPVCFTPLSADEYPERMDPPRAALHCNESGFGSGCPEGTHCASPQRLLDGRIMPVCVPDSDPIDRIDLALGTGDVLSRDDDEGVDVTLRFTLEGDDLPSRSQAVMDNSPWNSRIKLTHQESGQQWAQPLPGGDDDDMELALRPGAHDVVIWLNPADYAVAVPDFPLRGVLEVDGEGEGTIEVGAHSVSLTLRYRGNTLTSAESGVFIGTLHGTDDSRITHVFTGGERGIATVYAPPGVYRLTLRTNGQLASLFPSVSLLPPAQVEVPGTGDVIVDLDPILVEGTVAVELPDETPQANLIFAAGDGRLSLPLEDDGSFRALLWPGQDYAVLLQVPGHVPAVLAQDWRPQRDEHDLDAELTTVTFTMDATGLTVGQRQEDVFRQLQVRLSEFPDQTAWLQAQAAPDGDVFWETETVLGAEVDAFVQSNGLAMVDGRWTVAREAELHETTELSFELARVEITSTFVRADGTPISMSGSRVYFQSEDYLSSGSVAVGNGVADVRVPEGEWMVYVWPDWNSSPDRPPSMQYHAGLTLVEAGARIDLESRVYNLTGTATWQGGSWGRGETWPSGAAVTFQAPSTGGNSYWFDPHEDYVLSVGQGVFDVSFRCNGQGCVELGSGFSQAVVYQGVVLP